MTSRYRAISFDIGATLVSMETFGAAFYRMSRSMGIPANLDKLNAAADAVWDEVMRLDATTVVQPSPEQTRAWWREVNIATLRAAELPPESWDALDAAFMARLEDASAYSLFPDVLPTLAHLRRAGYRLGVISNWSWDLPSLCDRWAISPYLDFIVASARVGAAKPNAKIFQEALRLAGVLPGELLHVGDSYYADVTGAKAAGIDAILLNRQNKPVPADCVAITSIDGLLPLLDSSAR